MVSRFFLQDLLSFKEVELELKEGLVVFTGPSGAGKSLLMGSILSLFGFKDAMAKIAELSILNSPIENYSYGVEKSDEIVIKEIKKDKTRYFLNNQTISKRNLQDFSSMVVKYLHLKDLSDFESDNLIKNLDTIIKKSDSNYIEFLSSFEDKFNHYQEIKKRLQKILDDEKRLSELKEFAKFEIEKISSINPKEEEYEELNEVKQKLSKKDKVEELLEKAKPIFNYTYAVSQVLDILEVDSSFFDDAINELNSVFEGFNDSLFELEDIDIEEVLDRIEKLSSLQKRFGSIKEALLYKESKVSELKGYENISFEKSSLEKEIETLLLELEDMAKVINLKRVEASNILKKRVNYYLEFLYLSNADFVIKRKELGFSGYDSVEIILDGVSLDTISSGEFNRLRLALLTSISEFEIDSKGVLFLDEIDANLSGKESDAIAKVLNSLSKSYQIFAISHQPQLSATANQHFLVDKKDGVSIVKELNEDEKIEEISRMISGEVITKEAKEFAKNLVKGCN